MDEKIYKWVFAAGGSEVDCVNMDYIKGTTELALLYMLAQIQGDRANDPDYHIDYALKRLDQEPEDLSELKESLRQVSSHTFDDNDDGDDDFTEE